MRSLLRSPRPARWAGIFATGILASAGCGGGEDAAPSEATSNAVVAPEGGHEEAHGQPAQGVDGGHGGSAGGEATMAAQGHDEHSDPHGAPMAASGVASSHDGPAGMHESPDGAHGSPEYAHLPPPGQGSEVTAAHEGGAVGDGQNPTTEGWLAGLAASVMADTSGAPAPPGAVGPDGGHGAPGGYEGEMPGTVGYEGVPGVEGAGQQAPTQEFEAGTAEYAAQQLVVKMQAGETTGYGLIISAKTTEPTLSALRDGKADAELTTNNKELVEGAELVTIRETGSSKLFVVKNATGKLITITTRQDGDDHKVTGLKVETPRLRRGR